MAATAKVSISLTAEELEWARQQAKSSDSSLSAVVSIALRRQRQSAARRQLLKELGTDDISQEDLDAIRAEWR